jgi:hypothetical protein
MSFRKYVLTRKYDFGRGSKRAWAFIAKARGDGNLPDACSWRELRGYLGAAGFDQDLIQAAKVVWGSYRADVSRRSKLESAGTSPPRLGNRYQEHECLGVASSLGRLARPYRNDGCRRY